MRWFLELLDPNFGRIRLVVLVGFSLELQPNSKPWSPTFVLTQRLLHPFLCQHTEVKVSEFKSQLIDNFTVEEEVVRALLVPIIGSIMTSV